MFLFVGSERIRWVSRYFPRLEVIGRPSIEVRGIRWVNGIFLEKKIEDLERLIC